ncbi:MAG: hypothetical protein E7253_08570 [Lachnospiraceae bacterium]|nr:hypothetical protein [Lachnospiraceae bacterium]
MKKMKKRIISMIMAVVMIMGIVPVSVHAETNVPFSVIVNDQEMTNIKESTVTWTGWDGSTSDVICYTVAVPEGGSEATLIFEEEKQWSYYDSLGTYIGEGDTSWTSATEHTVAVRDYNDDGELDGISVQKPNEYSTEYYILFVYEEVTEEPNEPTEEAEKPFLSIKIDGKEVSEENIVYKGIFKMGDYDEDEQQEVEDTYNYVHEVPYYWVTVPCGTEYADITYSADTNIMYFDSDAYGYRTIINTEFDATTSATVKGTTFSAGYSQNADGTQTVKTPVKKNTVNADGNGAAITLEEKDSPYAAICLFSFKYDGINHVYEDGVCSCGERQSMIPEGAPFTAITTDDGEITNVAYVKNVDYTGWSTYEGIPYYHVTIPANATEVYVTHPFSEDPFADTGYGSAYGYAAETEGWTGSGMQFEFTEAEDGYTITLPLSTMVDTDGDWSADTEGSFVADEDGYAAYAVAVERNDYSPICFFTFEYAALEEGEHVHIYDDGVITTEPTCTEPGVKTFTCSGCTEGTEGHTKTEEVTKLGHSYDEGVVTIEPTCTEQGVKTFTCSICTEGTEGHTYTEKVTELGHSYDEGVVTTEPTCTEPGVKTYTCNVCTEETEGHTKTEKVDALGHSRDENRKCTVCGDVAPAQDENGVYQLGTADEMLWFANLVNNGEDTAAKAVLTDNIELDADWPGIGTANHNYAGTFDGQNHSVTLNNSTWGVFAYVMGTHKDHSLKEPVVIQNIIVDGRVMNSTLIQNAGYAQIINCLNKADITSENNKVAGILGDVIGSKKYGQTYSNVQIKNCGNEGNIHGNQNVGGILGSTTTNTHLDGCYNTGVISGSGNVGGLAGYMQGAAGSSSIKNSYNQGNITGNVCVAGIIGNKYNGVSIESCYNAGEATYAIVGNIYDNREADKITNTYYRGDLCSYSVPNVIGNGTNNFYTGNRGIAKTSTEMSGEEIASLLGDAFNQSCPAPVLVYQEASEHTIDKDICVVCKQGNNMPVEYVVTHVAPAGVQIIGDTSFRLGNDYTFSVDILDGYEAADGFSVYVNDTKVEAVENIYEVENPDAPFYITVTGVKEMEAVVSVGIPSAGGGYRISPCDGYGNTVVRGGDYKFTVDFIDGFEPGEDFVVKGNDEKLTADENGVYTIENITKAQKITVDGVAAISGRNSVTIRIDYTSGANQFLVSKETEDIMMDKEIEVPYFDIELYGLEKFYYNPYCYLDEEGNIRGQYKAGTREDAYNVVTTMHAFIYMTEVYYLGYDLEDAGTGYSDTMDADGNGISDFDEAVSWTQNVGSSFMDLWGLGTNLNYHLNYEYPIAYPEWGSTSDQQALKDGDLISVHMIQGSASGSGFGLFVVNDTNNVYDRTDERDSATVKQGESIKLTHYLATQGDHYTTRFVTAEKELYWIEEYEQDEDIRKWNRDGFGTNSADSFKTDENGEIIIDTTGIEPGTYYIGAAGGFVEGNGQAGSDGFVSAGTESGPAYFRLTVEEADESEPGGNEPGGNEPGGNEPEGNEPDINEPSVPENPTEEKENWWNKLFGSVAVLVKDAIDTVIDSAEKAVTNWVKDNIVNPVVEGVDKVTEKAEETVNKTWNDGKLLEDAHKIAENWVKDNILDPVIRPAEKEAEKVIIHVTDKVEQAEEIVTESVEIAKEQIISVEKIYEEVKQQFAAAEKTVEIAKDTIEKVKEQAEKVNNEENNFFDSISKVVQTAAERIQEQTVAICNKLLILIKGWLAR